MAALSKIAIILTLCIAALAVSLFYIQSTIWWAGYDMRNCLGCKPVIDWSKEKSSNVLKSQHVQSFKEDGVVVISSAIAESKVKDLAREVESMSDTFMTTVLGRFVLRQYSKYEHKLDTRSEMVRDWAVHGPLAKWAAELMNVKEARLYNAEKIYSIGEDNTMGCRTAWHRDTVAAPFPVNVRSVTINVYLDDISADGPNGDALIFVKGSHHNLETPPDVGSDLLFEPNLHVGDIVAHDPHVYHTPSGRGCWKRRSLQFRYVESPSTFEFSPNRFPHGPIPWTLAHAPGVAPHGLVSGSVLDGPWYPKVYPAPDESEHVPIDGSAWSLMGLLNVAKQAQDIAVGLGIGSTNCTIDDISVTKGIYKTYFGFDGPVVSCKDWEISNGIPVHKDGQMILNLPGK